MTKKHFRALASAMYEIQPAGAPGILYGEGSKQAQECWKLACQVVANVCQSQNPRFDREKFLEACGKGL